MNKIQNLLCSHGICDQASIVQVYPEVRDNSEIRVMKCLESGVIFLSSVDHMDIKHYTSKADFQFAGIFDRAAALKISAEDNTRRATQFGNCIDNRKWLDIGTGAGGILDLLAPSAAFAVAVEPSDIIRQELHRAGYSVFSDVSSVTETEFDVVTLFHVLEHFINPIETLKQIRRLMKEGGQIIIEVPHANDALLSLYDCESFKKFTFWSEHLILHTQKSLTVFLQQAGFSKIDIAGFQRYPLANHLHWLAKGLPGGHNSWKSLKMPELDKAYSDMLGKNNLTDTLIATANK